MGNNLGRLELKLDGATGVDKDRIPYADYDLALVIALIKALNGTLTKNIIEESQEFVLYKQKYYEELLTKYTQWIGSHVYYRLPDFVKMANVAAMALINAELMTLGFEEQMDVKDRVKSINSQCYGEYKYTKG